MQKVELRRKGDGWAVRVRIEDGTGMEYQFDSKNQARFFAAVLRMGPRELPTHGRPIVSRSRVDGDRI
jgi:hypothetical protein